MPNRGKLVIGSIVAVALLAAVSAWWYTYRQGQRILALWGPEAAYRIRLASDCELLAIQPAAEAAASDLVVDSTRWAVDRRVDLSRTRGFVHARQALIEDSSYRWDRPPAAPGSAQWEYAVRFRDEKGETLLVFDLQNAQVLDPRQERRADIAPIADGLRTFFAEQMQQESKDPEVGPQNAENDPKDLP